MGFQCIVGIRVNEIDEDYDMRSCAPQSPRLCIAMTIIFNRLTSSIGDL